MNFTNFNKSFENKYTVHKSLLIEEKLHHSKKLSSKKNLLESIDKSLNERDWKFTIPGSFRNAIFDAGDEEDFEGVRTALIDLCSYVLEHIDEANFNLDDQEYVEEAFEDFAEELDYVEFEDEDEANYYLNELYDLLDNTDIFLGLREGLNEEKIVGSGMPQEDIDLIKPLTNALDEICSNYDCDTTWNFGRRLSDNKMTAGVDVYFFEEQDDDALSAVEIAFEENGYELDKDLGYDLGPKKHAFGDGYHYQIVEIGSNDDYEPELTTDDMNGGQWYESLKESAKLVKPTKEQFEAYVTIQRSGVTNMFDINTVRNLAIDVLGVYLDKPQCLYIYKHYNELMDEYKDETNMYKSKVADFLDDYENIYLDESLKESLNEGYQNIDQVYDDVVSFLKEHRLSDRFYPEVMGDDWIHIDCSGEEDMMDYILHRLKMAGWDADIEDHYIEIYVGDLYESLNEDTYIPGSTSNAVYAVLKGSNPPTFISDEIYNYPDNADSLFTTDEKRIAYFDKYSAKQEVKDLLDEYADGFTIDDFEFYPHFDKFEVITEDTVKQNGKWVNKGKEGTHGKFKTKKEADAQRKAMFANKQPGSNWGK